MKKAVLTLSLCAALLMAASPGIRPRAGAESYPVHREDADYAIGAALIPPDQVKKMFKLDLNHAGYVVVEVGVFPAPGKDVDLYPTDFTLYTGDKFAALRPVSADTVAELVAGRPDTAAQTKSPHDVNTSAGASVGHVSYTDPVTGRRASGTMTETDAGIGVGAPAPQPCRGYDCGSTGSVPPTSQPSPTQRADTISQDLWEKSLPDGKTPRAVAGYLYFPKPAKKEKEMAWELRYENADAKVRLPLPK
jgi:hypothetical protein